MIYSSISPQLRIGITLLVFWFAAACNSVPHRAAHASETAASNNQGDEGISLDSALEIARLMAGKFQTVPGESGSVFSDQRIVLNEGPSIGTWLYYQLNTGESRKLYRQRFIKLTTINRDKAIQHTYQPTQPEQWESIWDQKEAKLSLAEADIDNAFEPGCELVWTRLDDDRWRGYVNPETCKYFSKRRGKNIYIESETVLSANKLKQAERGFDADGGQLFGTEPGEFLHLSRVQ